jgi:hypothetical protein
MKRSFILLVLVVVVFVGFSAIANAKLWDRGGGLIYDDVLNITWLQDASQRFTTGEAGGLTSPIRALLLAPL